MGNVMGDESFSVSEAARKLGVSIPTVKRMDADGELETFRTPGGHLRVRARSIDALHQGNTGLSRPRTGQPSTVLVNRRERVEELGLEAQELRAKREIARLKTEEEEEHQRRQEAIAARERDIERAAETEEREREHWRRQQAAERQRREHERRVADFHTHWFKRAAELLSDPKMSWLAGPRRREVLKALEVEIRRRHPNEEACMWEVISQVIGDMTGQWYADWRWREKLQEVMERELRSLPHAATDAERAKANGAMREALVRVPIGAQDFELRAAADEAIKPARQTIEKRDLTKRLTNWAIWELPWNRTDSDERRVRRECVQVLADLPDEVCEEEAKEALGEVIEEASEEIAERQEREDRKRQKAILVQQGLMEISTYLFRLREEGVISNEEYWNPGFKKELTDGVRDVLEDELSGEESAGEVKELVHEIIEEELDS